MAGPASCEYQNWHDAEGLGPKTETRILQKTSCKHVSIQDESTEAYNTEEAGDHEIDGTEKVINL
jgi:hypothetical protein